VQRSCARRYLPVFLASPLATVIASSAHGDPLTIPGHTVTDLGTGTPTLSTDAAGNGILTTGSGPVDAWQSMNSSVLTQAQIQAGGNPFGPSPYAHDPLTCGNPANPDQMEGFNPVDGKATRGHAWLRSLARTGGRVYDGTFALGARGRPDLECAGP
jgi:hypothetical protein